MFNRFKNITPFIALAIGLTIAQPTLASTINFFGVAPGANANSDTTASALGITFDNAAFMPTLDSTGTPIAGTDHWQIDTTLPITPVTVVNGSSLNAINSNASHYLPFNGLDATQQTVLMHLGGIYTVNNFSALASSFDGQSFLGSYNPTLDFLDINGNLLGSVAYSQGSSFIASWSTPLQGVSDVVLAGGAVYNSLSFNVSAVPVPSAVWLFGSTLAGLVGLRRRKA